VGLISSRLAILKAATTLSELAELLQFKPATISYVLFKQPDSNKYATFEIPKRRGGTRTIKAPVAALKLVQRRLSDLLQDCVDEINKSKSREDRIAHGFKRKRSIVTNAKRHRNRRNVFNIDLEDFFPSINFGRVRGFFVRDRDFALHKDVATVIAQIACNDNELPQGSPCSPVISNLVAHVLDMHLVRLAAKVGCTYSRYADDLTFSTNKKDFPTEIAMLSENEPHVWLPGKELQRLIEFAGFRVNSSKTRMQYRTSRQEVTGLVVNRVINVKHEYCHNVRAMVRHLIKTGSFERYGAITRSGVVTLEKRKGTLNELHGMLGFIDNVRNHDQVDIPDGPPAVLSSQELLYRQFLLYKDFYAAEEPVIICEGETDNVYLTHAIRSLASEFPELADTSANGKIRVKVRIYKYSRSSTSRILGLNDGGISILIKFISTYRSETEAFTAPGLKNPVIILYDNDAGAKDVRATIKRVAKLNSNGTEPFVHVVKNLYAVPTPLLTGATESKIEDFFDTAIKEIAIEGKTFNDKNKFDITKHYGKKIFSHRVVRPRAESINFEGFRQLLTNLAAAVNEHHKAVSRERPRLDDDEMFSE
jgi:RNA-directed DNA polymerase